MFTDGLGSAICGCRNIEHVPVDGKGIDMVNKLMEGEPYLFEVRDRTQICFPVSHSLSLSSPAPLIEGLGLSYCCACGLPCSLTPPKQHRTRRGF